MAPAWRGTPGSRCAASRGCCWLPKPARTDRSSSPRSALVGLDGTVRHRFRNGEFTGHMHLKTGTLNGVRAMAGYVQAPSGRRFAVAIIQNASGWGEEAQAALLRWVYRQ